ncbi:hypothetical protein LZ554_007288 [Drepanopeziza brunnea f. sp. 'monogermtubi']|nr:hypothetical protein LZ554_007288 [Drepanopeziza brunnea f. sp. 'monogermtubi']
MFRTLMTQTAHHTQPTIFPQAPGSTSHLESAEADHQEQVHQIQTKMQISIIFFAALATVAMASASPKAGGAPAWKAVPIDCSTCGCSSAESCTFDCCQ